MAQYGIGRRMKGILAAIVLSYLYGTAPVMAAAAANDAPNQMVTVARDMTAQADCTVQINSVPTACPIGTVVGDFQVTRAEAEAQGEVYVILGDDPATYRAGVNRLTAFCRGMWWAAGAASSETPPNLPTPDHYTSLQNAVYRRNAISSGLSVSNAALYRSVRRRTAVATILLMARSPLRISRVLNHVSPSVCISF